MDKLDLTENKQLENLLFDIENRIENGFLDSGINRAKSHLLRYPDEIQLHYLLIKAYMEKEDYGLCKKHIQLGDRLSSDNLKYTYIKGEYYLKTGDSKLFKDMLHQLSSIKDGEKYHKKLLIKYYLNKKDYNNLRQLLLDSREDEYIEEKLKMYYETDNIQECKKLANRTRLKSPNSKEGILASEYLRKIKNKKITQKKEDQALENALNELNSLIGLRNVKNEIEKIVNFVKFQKLRQSQGIIDDNIPAYHLGFYGNPGTGKTTVARLLGQIFKELGILEKGHLVEVDRSDLVVGYIGQTAIKTKEMIEKAYGGILFIDEAYSLARGSEQDFGAEAIDTLIKAMEDDRDKFIVILAGYTDQMADLMDMNPGLKSRITLEIEFEDYNDEELLEIGELIAKSSNYKLSEDGKKGFLQKIEEEKCELYFSNGRACRNIIEAAARRRASRVMSSNTSNIEDLTTLDAIDFGVDLSRDIEDDLEEHILELNSLIGLNNVKNEIEKIKTQVMVNQARKEKGLFVENQSYHMIFTGNPGTGKTTVARLLGKIFKSLGVLSKGHVVEVDRSDLVSGYIGKTAIQTKKAIQSAYGGILFVDEAYSLAKGGNQDFGSEAVDTLLKEMEDNRDKFIVVLAGYTNEMRRLLDMNPGLKSRINLEIDFPDYTDNELLEIANLIANQQDYKISKDGQEAFMRRIEKEKMDDNFANARVCRNLIEEAIRRNSYRVVKGDFSLEEMTTLKSIDFGIKEDSSFEDNINYHMEKLNSLIGLDEVKESLRKIKNQVLLNQRRLDAGLDVSSSSYHMIFTGNPGTGKTTVARIVADIFKSLGVLSRGHLVEVDRSDLVAGYVGQTAMKTKDVIKSAYGGVLFIDEAYSLARGSEQDFGSEAIDTLIKAMEDDRDRLVVIFAGYTKEMEELLNLNSGLRSRVGNIIEFKDYNSFEMFEIFKMFLQKEKYYLSNQALDFMRKYIDNIVINKDENFGNGRTVRNIFEELKLIQAERVVEDLDADILEIRLEDVLKLNR